MGRENLMMEAVVESPQQREDGEIQFSTDGTIHIGHDDPDLKPPPAFFRFSPTRQRSRSRVSRSAPASPTKGIVCRLERKYEPVFTPTGQGPFRKGWIPTVRSQPTPAEMFAAAKDILDAGPSAALKKKSSLFGNIASRHGVRKVGCPSFGGFSERRERSAYGGWMKAPDTPGPGSYDMRSKYAQPLMHMGPANVACQSYSHARWPRASRSGNAATGKDPDIQWEFGYVTVDAVRKSSTKSTISDSVLSDRERSAAPGPDCYLPSVRAVTADSRGTTFSKAPRDPPVDPFVAGKVNAGPKYSSRTVLGTGYPQAQCTFTRAPTGRLPEQPFHT